jgi:hypothetical protein
MRLVRRVESSRRIGGVEASRPKPTRRESLHFSRLGQAERVLDLHSEVFDSRLDFRMSEEYLHSPQIADLLIDQRGLRPTT